MKKHLAPNLVTASMLLASAAMVPGTVRAAELSAGNTEANNEYNNIYNMALMRAEYMRQLLAKERADRAAADVDLRNTIQERMDDVDDRVTSLNQRVTSISDQIDLSESGFLAEVEQLRIDTQTLRTRMNAELARLDREITILRNYMNSNVANLQTQINSINASINDLNTQMTQIRTRLTNAENFANALHSRLEQLRTCFANGSCVGYRTPQVELRTIDLWGNGGGYGGSNTYFTNLRSSEWQYCSLAGATNQGYRDFRIWESGGWWYVANEHGGNEGFLGFGAAQGGTLWARCMRIY